MDILEKLNEKQKEAVQQVNGPVLILAGAGSGKTRALTHRIAYLIRNGVNAQNILAVTFTNKAANEMRERVEGLLGENTIIPFLGTFHSICVKILRREARNIGFDSNFTIYDSDDSLRAIKQAMRKLQIDEKKYNPKAARSFISSAKGELINSKDYTKFAFEHFQHIVAKVYSEYQSSLNTANAFDFDDLILKTVEMFRGQPGILEKYQEKFKYILIDEYQDTNHAQYIFVKLLANKYRNIFAIGDDWQSIYSFRGAKFQNILDFQKDYPDAKIIYLEENYRSTEPILSAAQQVIYKNEMRSDKKIFTNRNGGAPVTLAIAQGRADEIEFIIDEIFSIKRGDGRELSDFSILYRTNFQSRLIEEFLIRRAIPYRIFGSLRFYERKEIKDILAYLNFIINPGDQVALTRSVNTPPRGIGDKSVEKILKGEGQDLPKYKKFIEFIEKMRELTKVLSPDQLIEKIIAEIGFREYLNDGTIEGQSRIENLEELKSAASAYESISDFLQSVALVSDIDNYSKDDQAVTLMTVHSAKGLEFPVVFITGLEEGLFPHSQSISDQYELEEERRLLYVGMTRAMDRLYLSLAKTKFSYGMLEPCQPSRFVKELPDEVEQIDL